MRLPGRTTRRELIARCGAVVTLAPLTAFAREDKPNRFDERDRRVLEAALKDLTDPMNPEHPGTRTGGPGRLTIVLDRMTPPMVQGFNEQILEDAERKPGFPKELSGEWKHRNVGLPVRLPDFSAKDKYVVMDDIGAIAEKAGRGMDAFVGAFRTRHPDAVGWVRSYLPGYTRDGRTAVAVFDAGPAFHYMTWVHQLALTEGRWGVVWRHCQRM